MSNCLGRVKSRTATAAVESPIDLIQRPLNHDRWVVKNDCRLVGRLRNCFRRDFHFHYKSCRANEEFEAAAAAAAVKMWCGHVKKCHCWNSSLASVAQKKRWWRSRWCVALGARTKLQNRFQELFLKSKMATARKRLKGGKNRNTVKSVLKCAVVAAVVVPKMVGSKGLISPQPVRPTDFRKKEDFVEPWTLAGAVSQSSHSYN